jgi:hypothetical protein
VDSRLLEIARHKVASSAKRCGISLKQTFAKEGRELRRKAGGGWRQLPWPVDDNYPGRLKADAGQVLEAGLA